MSLDLERLVAIDVHVHAERNAGEEQDPVTGEILARGRELLRRLPPQPTAEEVAAHYRERNMAAVVFTVDDEAGMGRRRLGNDEVLEAAAANPDVLIPFASVDPHKGKLGVREARELIERGVRGFKFHPNIAGVLAQRPSVLPALRGDRGGRADRAVPYRHDRHRRRACRAAAACA